MKQVFVSDDVEDEGRQLLGGLDKSKCIASSGLLGFLHRFAFPRCDVSACMQHNHLEAAIVVGTNLTYQTATTAATTTRQKHGKDSDKEDTSLLNQPC